MPAGSPVAPAAAALSSPTTSPGAATGARRESRPAAAIAGANGAPSRSKRPDSIAQLRSTCGRAPSAIATKSYEPTSTWQAAHVSGSCRASHSAVGPTDCWVTGEPVSAMTSCSSSRAATSATSAVARASFCRIARRSGAPEASRATTAGTIPVVAMPTTRAAFTSGCAARAASTEWLFSIHCAGSASAHPACGECSSFDWLTCASRPPSRSRAIPFTPVVPMSRPRVIALTTGRPPRSGARDPGRRGSRCDRRP